MNTPAFSSPRRAWLRHVMLISGAVGMAATVLATTKLRQVVPSDLDLVGLASQPTQRGEHRVLLQLALAGTRWVAVGEGGLVLLSDDEGRRWRQALTPTAVMLTAVSFATPQRGWAVGHDGVILGTEDGGGTWTRRLEGRAANEQVLASAQRQLQAVERERGDARAMADKLEAAEERVSDAEAAVAAGASRPLFGITFLDEAHGFAVGSFGQVFETRDGGRAWHFVGDRLDNPGNLHLNSITAAGKGELLIAAEAGRVFRSTDAGATWSTIDVGYAGQLYGVVALQGSAVRLAYGFGGHAFRSDDGAVHWAAVAVPVKRALMQAVDREGSLWLLAQDGRLLRSDDLGRSFTLASVLAGDNLSSFAMTSGAILSAGMRGVRRTELPQGASR